MRSEMIVNNGQPRLLMLFCGWGTDAAVVRGLAFPGYDMMALWDYRSLDFDTSLIDGYEEIVVAAWSFGVAAAACFLDSHRELPVTRRVAVNGTLHPVDDALGIPEAIFQGTLDGLDERNLAKFYRRMALRRPFEAPGRGIGELREELTAIRSLNVPVTPWDMAFVSADDRIIPPDNQAAAWSGTPLRRIGGPHLPDFAGILAPLMIDKGLVARRFGAAAESYDAEASVQRRIADRLLSIAPLDTEVCVEIGSGTGVLTRRLLSLYTPKRLVLVDFNPADAEGAESVKADAEQWIASQPDASVSALVSASAMQWFNSPLRFISHVRRVLRPGGVALLSTFGPETMRELEGLAPRLPYLHPSELPEVVDTELITLTFDTPADALRYMHRTGVNGISSTPADALRAVRRWPLTPDGKVSLTFQPIYIKITK